MKNHFYAIIFSVIFSTTPSLGDADNINLSFYTGTFDVIDKEGDDKTTLLGIEHKNPDLFRDTFLGKFKPVSGAFITGNSSVYLYTGIEGQYGLGPLKFYQVLLQGIMKRETVKT